MLLSFAGQTGRAKMVDLAKGFWSDAPRILPLGDSNTLGFSNVLAPAEYESYRRELWSLAAEDRFWFDYVGGRANGPASLPDRNHQGVGGIRATTVVDQASDLAATHRPDVVLLMLGTNDALNEANAASTVRGELLSIMRSIDAVQPDVTILLAPLPPIDPTAPSYRKRADADEIRAAINAQLPDLAQAAQAEGIDARLVPMPGLGKGDLFDGVHPTAAGHAKIAAAFYEALEEGLASGEFGGPRTSTAGVRDLTGSEAGDFLGGDASGNRIEGGAGADVLRGRRGADALKGGLDDDTLRGGGGRDVFVFDDRDGGDVIRGFQNRKDKIQIEGGAAGFDELAMTEIDGDAHVAFARTEITLRDVDIADLGPGDFLFV